MFRIIDRVASLALVLACLLLASCSNGPLQAKVAGLSPFQQLATMDWQLVGVKHGLKPPLKRSAVDVSFDRYQLRFDKGRMQLKGGCNLINSTVKVTSAGRLSVGPMMMTNRGCNTRLMQTDLEISRTLSQVTHYRLQERQLAMLGARKILLFDGSPTPETIYGNKGARKFIEVRSAKKGLQWREAKYDSRWVRVNKDAPWSEKRFPGIQGFRPLPNYEYIVRVKEFFGPGKRRVWIKDIVTSQGLLR